MYFFIKNIVRIKKVSIKGFTLIELSVVIVIFGISLMFLTPTLVEKFSGVDPLAEVFDRIISLAHKKSKEINKPVFIRGLKGHNTLKTDFKTVTVEGISSFLTVSVNGNTQTGGEFYIGVYPEGFIDSFEIVTDRGTKIVSQLNSLRVKVEQ